MAPALSRTRPRGPCISFAPAVAVPKPLIRVPTPVVPSTESSSTRLRKRSATKRKPAVFMVMPSGLMNCPGSLVVARVATTWGVVAPEVRLYRRTRPPPVGAADDPTVGTLPCSETYSHVVAVEVSR